MTEDHFDELVAERTTEEWLALVKSQLAEGKVHHLDDDFCPVVALLYSAFGEDLAEYLIWNQTCFPFSDTEAGKQAVVLVEQEADKWRAFWPEWCATVKAANEEVA